jgi:NADPH:quinone reductase
MTQESTVARQAQAIVVAAPGGPEVLTPAEVEVAAPGPGEIRVVQKAIGVNYIDVYHRSGQYKVPRLPFIPGMEGVGIIDAVGLGVTDLRPGDRVGYASNLGAYAQVRLLPATAALPVPEGVSDEQAASIMLKGLTAQYLLRQTVPLEPGDQILFHAAAGGVGLVACAWARHLGLRLIATAGGPEKCARALSAGAAHAIDYRAQDFVARVKELTDGAGVRAVFDGVGADTFLRSLDCLKPFGMMVAFGQASGPVPPLDIQVLSAKGSLYLTRPTIMTYAANRPRYLAMARELFDMVARGVVKPEVQRRYPLGSAADAHRDLQGRVTSGASILVP